MSQTVAYGVIDLASAVSLRSKVVRLPSAAAVSLLDDKAYFDCLAVGPWLVDLDRCTDLRGIWRRQVHDHALGYTVYSSLDLRSLRRHFRKFALVQLEGQKKPVLFRYFDARVLRQFMLEGFSPDQRAKFMEPLDKLEIKTIDGTSTHEFVGSEDRHPANAPFMRSA